MTVSRRVSFATVTTTLLVGLSGCGSNTGSTVSTAPTPSPPPGPLAIVQDRAAGTLLTLDVNPQTGTMAEVSSLAVSYPGIAARNAFAVDPGGRFVYVAVTGGISSYVVNKTSGQLTISSTVVPDHGSTSWLAASERQLYGVFQVSLSGFGSAAHGLRFPVDPSNGALSGPMPLPHNEDQNIAVPDAAGKFVYSDSISAMIVSRVEPDGSLVDVDGVDLPLGWPILAAMGPGFLALTDDWGNLLTAGIDPVSGAIAPRQRVTEVFGDAYLGNTNTPKIAVASTGLIGFLGLQTHQNERNPAPPWSLQTWHVDPTGTLERRAEVSLSPARGRHLAFDTSGRFLYVSGFDGGIEAFAVSEDGGLRSFAQYPWGSGPILMIAR